MRLGREPFFTPRRRHELCRRACVSFKMTKACPDDWTTMDPIYDRCIVLLCIAVICFWFDLWAHDVPVVYLLTYL